MRGLLFALALGVAFGAAAQDRTYTVTAVTEAEPTWTVEIADEPQEHSRGLMFRRSMPAMTGMLFDFGQMEPVSMWMHNTYIALDMVFICADGTIARIAANTVPETDTVISSGEDVRYVLEINAGEAAKHGLERGVEMASRDGLAFFQGDNHGCGQ